MTTIAVPTRDEVSPANQAIFDSLEKRVGKVPNLYAVMAHSETALGNYLALLNAKSTITGKAREVINLAVSEVNGCEYCLASHTFIGRMQGFTDAQIIEIRRGRATFDPKLDALARFASSAVADRGHVDASLVDDFFAAGWTKANLIDAIVAIGEKTVANYLHGVTRVPIDFPAAPSLLA